LSASFSALPAPAGVTVTNPLPALQVSWKPRVNPWLIAMTVALAAFMEVLDTSIANVALPHIAGSLGASTNEGTWVLTSYLVANAIVLPMGAWASSVLGRRNFFLLCIVVFTISSFLCGAAPSLPILLICRILQGAGGGGMQPMAQAIMADSFEPQKRGQAFALYGLVAVLAPSIGPTLGGWITDNFSWRWIFFINIPVGILAFFLVSRLVEDPPWIKADRSRLRQMDYLGFAFLTIAMGGLQIMLDKGEENDWFASPFICFFAFLFVAGMAGLFFWEWNHKAPLINIRLFRYKNFAICCLLMMLVGGVLNASTVLQPQFMQQLLGWTATIAGLALTAGGFTLVIVMPLAGILTGKVAARWLAVIGFTMFIFTYYYAAHVTTLDMTFSQAITGAQVTSRSTWHQQHLQNAMTYASQAFQQQSQALSGFFGGGFGGPNGGTMALASIYNQLNRQAVTQGYQDVYMELSWMSVGLVVLAFLLSANRPGQGGGGGGMH